MGKAVDVAERNTARFGLTQAEVASRRRWIMQTQREVRRRESAQQCSAPSMDHAVPVHGRVFSLLTLLHAVWWRPHCIMFMTRRHTHFGAGRKADCRQAAWILWLYRAVAGFRRRQEMRAVRRRCC